MPTIYPLFSAPVYVNNVGEFEKPSLESLQFTSTMADGTPYNFLSTVDKNVLERPDFKAVRDVVVRELDRYTRELLAVNKEHRVLFHELVDQRPSAWTLGRRAHAPQLIDLRRAVPQDERSSGDIVFHRDVLSLVPFPPALDLDIDSFNLYNCKSGATAEDERHLPVPVGRQSLRRSEPIRRGARFARVQRLRARRVRRAAQAQHPSRYPYEDRYDRARGVGKLLPHRRPVGGRADWPAVRRARR